MSKDVDELVRDLDPAGAKTRILQHRKPVRAKPAGEEKEGLPRVRNAADLIATMKPKPPVLIEGMLYKGGTMVYGGGAKTNKTFAMMELAVSVAGGVSWLGRETTQGEVLYIDFELEDWDYRDRLEVISNAKGVSMDAVGRIDVWNLRGHAADLSVLVEEIIKQLKSNKYSLIIFDPLYKVLGSRDENSAGDINSLMNELDKIAVASGAGIVISHHFSKGNQAGKESMDRISGSGVFARSPDAIVILTKHAEEDVFTVEATVRSFKRPEPFCVEWKYPLMELKPDANPANLKKSGAGVAKFTTDQLLDALGDDELTTGDWQKRTCDATGMSPRTFADKKNALLKEWNRRVEQGENDKWKKVAPKGYQDTRIIKPIRDLQLQTANAAIASATQAA